MVLHPGGLSQPVLHPVHVLGYHQQLVLGLDPQLVVGLVLRLVLRPQARLGVQFAFSLVLAFTLPLEGGQRHDFGLGGLQP